MHTSTKLVRILNLAVAGVLALALAAAIGVGPVPGDGATTTGSDAMAVLASPTPDLAPVTPDLTVAGSVALEAVVPGVYSGTLSTPTPDPTPGNVPPDLGAIDVAFQLTRTGQCLPLAPCVLAGYVDLEYTLVYSRAHAIDMPEPTPDLAVGPYVRGTYDGTLLQLELERSDIAAAGRTIERQAVLSATLNASGDGFAGEYRETIWGYGPQPMTLIGAASTLSRLTPTDPGDCNGDLKVDAGDLSAIILEIFDGDGSLPLDASIGAFSGSGIGCNANGDGIIDAGDISCAVILIFGGTCSGGT